jgi:hypothetical protein
VVAAPPVRTAARFLEDGMAWGTITCSGTSRRP